MRSLVVAAVVGVAGLAGAAGYWYFGRATAPAVASLAAAPPAAAPEAPSRRLVETLPAFELADRDGRLRSIHDWRGKALVVNFWATWCAPCRREIPLLQRIARDRADQGFEVVGIAVDFRDKVLAYAEEMNIEYPLLIGEQDALDAAAAFGVEAVGFPFTVFTDVQGRVITAQMGELTEQAAEVILDAVAAVNKGEKTPAEARQAIAGALWR